MDRRAEFDRLLEPVLGVAYGTALKLTASPEDAMDLVQDASVSAYNAFHQFEPGTNFKAWFFKILTNRFYKNRARSARQNATVSIDDAEDLFLFQQFHQRAVRSQGDDPLGDLFDSLDQDAAQVALDRLPDDYRTAAVLYFMNDFSYEQIAQVLEVPIGTVRSRIHRGRKLLQRELWQVAVDRGIVQEEVDARG